jgi:hypothetical protein
MDKQCIARNANGARCQAQPVRPSGYCWFHDPAIDEERTRKRREGGANRSNAVRAKKSLPAEPLAAEEIRSYLGLVFRGLIGGKVEPSMATAAANVARALLDVAKAAELEQEVANLRRDLAAFAERRGLTG